MQLFDERRRLSLMFDYVFGRGVSGALPKSGLKLVYSRKSGRVKEVLHDGKLFATVKTSGAIALSVYGAGRDVLPRSEVAVLDRGGRVIGVGRAIIAGRYMQQFYSGVAVKVRQGAGSS